ncbi:MAG: NPCBM/NEW2 domain-containing protein [Pirellulaceae bacterium]
MNTALMVRSLILLPGICAATAAWGGQDAPVLERLLAVQSIADQRQGAEKQAAFEAAQIRCGVWHAIGPLKDAEYGVFGREFGTVFDPERDVLARGQELAELDKSYDGQETWLTELKPLEAQVGFMELFVNQNYVGKRLTIGTQEFAHGFWTHAPSVLVFPLDGQFEWFDASIGLDGLAVRSGSSEFVIAESLTDVSPQHLDAHIRPLLWRDFPGRPVRHEIEREMADGIWINHRPGSTDRPCYCWTTRRVVTMGWRCADRCKHTERHCEEPSSCKTTVHPRSETHGVRSSNRPGRWQPVCI